MIDYELLNKQIHSFNPIKMNPKDELFQQQVSAFMKQMNEVVSKSYAKTHNTPISNYPTDDMIEFTSTNPVSTLCMSNMLSMVYDENTQCFVLEGPVYELHQQGIGNDEFNAFLLWTRVFAKLGSIELAKHDKEHKLIEFKVIDKTLVKNLEDYCNNDLEAIRGQLKQLNMQKYSKYLDKYADAERLSKMSDNELQEMAENDSRDLITQMMNDITRLTNGIK